MMQKRNSPENRQRRRSAALCSRALKMKYARMQPNLECLINDTAKKKRGKNLKCRFASVCVWREFTVVKRLSSSF
jgi:hypothetical protein